MGNLINSGDTAWVLVCCSLVLLMTPALALFYRGMNPIGWFGRT